MICVRDPLATEAFAVREERVQEMVALGLMAATGQPSVREAWLSLVSTQDTVGIKVYSAPGPLGGTRPAVVLAVARSLMDAGIPKDRIVLWDRRLADLRRGGYAVLAERAGIQVAGAEESGYQDETFYESPILGNLIAGDHEVASKDKPGVGRKSFVSRLLTGRLTKIVNVSPLLVHSQSGVAGNLYSLAMGSVDNTQRFDLEARRLATAVPELYAMAAVGDKAVFHIVDALICQYQGDTSSQLHYSVALNQLRFSADPVALDVLSIKEIQLQRETARMPAIPLPMEMYDNAAILELGQSEERKIRVEKLP